MSDGRLIDADKAIEEFCGYCTLDPVKCGGECSFLSFLNRQATFDPFRHGHWVWNPDAYDWGIGAWCCNICGCINENLPSEEHPSVPIYAFAASHYCNNCGSKMDERIDKHETD